MMTRGSEIFLGEQYQRCIVKSCIGRSETGCDCLLPSMDYSLTGGLKAGRGKRAVRWKVKLCHFLGDQCLHPVNNLIADAVSMLSRFQDKKVSISIDKGINVQIGLQVSQGSNNHVFISLKVSRRILFC